MLRTNLCMHDCDQACAYGHGPVVEALLEAKADIDQQSQPYEEGTPGWRAHQAAVANGHNSEVMLPPGLLEEHMGLEGIFGPPPARSFR